MVSIEEINSEVKKILSSKRYNHSVGVMNRAAELAKIYGADIEKAKACGLAHDIAKEMNKEEYEQYIKNNNINVDEIEKIKASLLHGKIGADMAKKKFNFSVDMQKAIEYHTTTDPNMDMLAKIIYVADKTEIGRESKYYDIKYERELADKDIDEAIIYIINENIKDMLSKNKIIHPKCIETRNKLIFEKNKKI